METSEPPPAAPSAGEDFPVGFCGGLQRVDALNVSVSEIGLARAESGVGVEGPGEVGGQYRPGFDRERVVGLGIFRRGGGVCG